MFVNGCSEAAMSDCCGDGPTKTILLCDKATLIPLCETCKEGPPTAAVRYSCVFHVYSTYSNGECADIVSSYILVCVNMFLPLSYV